MATTFQGWGDSWGSSWGGDVAPTGFISGTAHITLSASGTLTAGDATPVPAGRPHPFAQHFPRIAIPHRRPRRRRQEEILFL